MKTRHKLLILGWLFLPASWLLWYMFGAGAAIVAFPLAVLALLCHGASVIMMLLEESA